MFRALGHMLRLTHASWVMAREGVFSEIDPEILPPAARVPLSLAKFIARKNAGANQPKLARAMVRLGPSYVKLGQFLATRPDIVGVSAAQDLEALQDRMPPFPMAQAIQAIERNFGKKVDELFEDLKEPISAASIAQVHRARVRDEFGVRDVAVKVARPGIERRFKRDISDMLYAAYLAERYSAEARRLRMIGIVQTLARTVKMEMDFRLEAAAASEFAENVADDPDFRVPAVDWDRTARDVLTTEWIDGIHMSDIAALKKADVDMPRLGRVVIQSFLRHAVRDGFFHADMHPGNLFVDREGRLVAVDFGIMGRLGTKERRFLAEILYGFIVRDYRRVAEVHFEAGYVPRTQNVEDFAQAIRAIGEPIHSRTADQISMARLLGLLFEITALFEMRTRTELVLLQKTMVVVEGVGRTLDPKLDMWSTAEPVVGDWIREKLGPKGIIEEAGQGLALLARVVKQGPEFVQQLELLAKNLENMPNGDVTFAAVRGGGASRPEEGHWFSARSALWVIAAILTIAFLI